MIRLDRKLCYFDHQVTNLQIYICMLEKKHNNTKKTRRNDNKSMEHSNLKLGMKEPIK